MPIEPPTPGGLGRLVGELGAVREWTALLADPVYWGVGLARGRGQPVLVLPGLFANDLYLHPLRAWLARIGYAPVPSTLRVNAGCSERLSREAEEPLREAMTRRPGPVAVIGHSRGGMLARAIAARLGGAVSVLILLGAPVGAFTRLSDADLAAGAIAAGAAPVVDASLRARRILDPDCRFPACGCPFPADLRRPLDARTRVVSIYSRSDQIVPPAASPIEGADNVEVGGTHSGLVYNRAAYHAMAAALARDAAR